MIGLFRVCRWIPVVLSLFVPQPAIANSVGDALTKFGLIGEWSTDCKRDPHSIGGDRLTFYVSFFGFGTAHMIYSSTNPFLKAYSETDNEIDTAKILDGDEIAIVTRGVNLGNEWPDEFRKFFERPVWHVIKKETYGPHHPSV